MKQLRLHIGSIGSAVLGFLALESRVQAAPSNLLLDFAAVTGAAIQFIGSGNELKFQPVGPGDHFEITFATGGVGDSVGKRGRMNGLFTVGPISSFIVGAQNAPVFGTGNVLIHDGIGNDLSATLAWDEIATAGTGGALNLNGVVNLFNIAYSGPVADLQALAAGGSARHVLTFQFIPGRTLTQLTQDGIENTTSFSGNLLVVPEPGVYAFGAFGLGLLMLARRRK